MLLLHGGAARRKAMAVSPAQLSVLRMIPLGWRMARAGRGRLAVHRLLNTHRGWDTSHTPVQDVAWALAQLAERYGDLPVSLVGHSLGGRAALLAGDGANVRSVVALNPWLYVDDRPQLSGRQVLFVHGTADRIAPIAHARTVAERVAHDTSTGFIEVEDGKHAMLRQAGKFGSYAAEFAASTLLGPDRVRVSAEVADAVTPA